MSIQIGQQLGSYEITAWLGRGSMGEVYRARDLKLKREVAIKILPEEFVLDSDRLNRFQREAEVLASLNHPNIAGIYDFQEARGSRYLVLELVEGEALDERITRGPIPIEDALNIAKSICEALEAAHERGIVHRDLKPANVKITPDGRAKVLDFGLAKQIRCAPESDTSNFPTMSTTATQAGMILGTAAYMSPEQAKGKVADKRADIWAFGVVMYELLTGERLFQGENVTETLAAVVKDQPAFDRVPHQVRRLLKKCLEKDPKKRLRDIGDAWELLEEPSGTNVVEVVPYRTRLSIWALASTGVLAAALAVLAFVHFRETLAPLPTLRYFIPLPEEFPALGLRLAVSPNGSYIVFSGGSLTSRRQLWLYRLNSMQAAQPIPGTDDAVWPFWSPDSRWIGFFASGSLRKMPVEGGPSQPVCDGCASDTVGGTWNRDDVILFTATDGEKRVLRRVSAAGGPVTDISKSMLPVLGTLFLPDGRHFLYTVANSAQRPSLADGKAGIYLASLDSQEETRLLPDSSNAAYAPSRSKRGTGYILFVREDSLMAQPFDENSRRIFGEAVPIAEELPTGGGTVAGYRPISVSTNGVLVYRTPNGAASTNQIVWYDNDGKIIEPVSTPGSVWTPSLSPDEKTVAFARFTGLLSDIWLWDFAHKIPQKFTTDPSRNDAPVWSPHSDRIAFRSTRTGQQEIWLKEVGGPGKEEMVPTDTNSKFPTQFSADGRFLVYSDNGLDKTRLDILYVPLEGDRKPVAFLRNSFAESQGQISPDGHWMAFASDKTGRREVYVSSFPSGEGEVRISTDGGEQPRWRRTDGRELYYVALDGKMMSVKVKPSGTPKSTFERDTPVQMFDSKIATSTETRAFQYDVSADGKRFLVNTNVSTSSNFVSPLTVVFNWWPK